MVTHSRIFAWKIPWTEEPGGLSPWGRKECDMAEHAHVDTHTQLIHFAVQQKLPQHCKATIRQQNLFKK